MPYLKPERPEKVSAPSLIASKARGERLVCLTAYDYPTARIVDEAGIDVILVGDSLGNVVLGYGNTVPVTLEEILVHVKAVRRGVERALLVADMPYGSFHTGADDTVRSALRLVKEGEAEAVKLEGGQKRVKLVRRLVNEEIAVMGHIGLTPQSISLARIEYKERRPMPRGVCLTMRSRSKTPASFRWCWNWCRAKSRR